jgi:hypothetical protein
MSSIPQCENFGHQSAIVVIVTLMDNCIEKPQIIFFNNPKKDCKASEIEILYIA